MAIRERKKQHLSTVAGKDVTHRGSTLFECVNLLHHAVPELDLDEIDLTTEFMGKSLKAPLMITSMTGGAEYAGDLNRGLAEVAAQHGIAFAVGSQRVMLHHPESRDDFAVRDKIPDGLLLGNIGVGQLEEYSPDVIEDLVKAIDADGICVHLNVAHELVQHEGHRTFRGILDGISRLVDRLGGRVLVKETGAGLSPQALEQLNRTGVTCIDVAGAGGTSWTRVESHRTQQKDLRRLGETFGDWGVPTAFSVLAAKRLCGEGCRIMASGGIQNGLDAARSIAAGADLVGFARPVLLAFLQSGVKGASGFVRQMADELKSAMLLTGASGIKSLQDAPRVYTGELREWLLSFGWLSE